MPQDTDGDGICNINCGQNKYGRPEINIDTNNDQKPDLNIDKDGDNVPDINVDTNNNGIPDLNVDLNDDGTPDVNIDTNNDGVCDLNCQGDDVIIEIEPPTNNELILYISYKQTVNANNILPGWTGVQEFIIINNSNYQVAYNLNWENVLNTFNKGKGMVYSLYRDDQKILNELDVPESDSKLLGSVILPPKTTQRYKVVYEFKETHTNQNSEQGKIFSADIIAEVAN